MDPDAAVELALYDINSGDVVSARERLRDVDEWIARGGYVPSNYAFVLDRYNALETDVDDALAPVI